MFYSIELYCTICLFVLHYDIQLTRNGSHHKFNVFDSF